MMIMMFKSSISKRAGLTRLHLIAIIAMFATLTNCLSIPDEIKQQVETQDKVINPTKLDANSTTTNLSSTNGPTSKG